MSLGQETAKDEWNEDVEDNSRMDYMINENGELMAIHEQDIESVVSMVVSPNTQNPVLKDVSTGSITSEMNDESKVLVPESNAGQREETLPLDNIANINPLISKFSEPLQWQQIQEAKENAKELKAEELILKKKIKVEQQEIKKQEREQERIRKEEEKLKKEQIRIVKEKEKFYKRQQKIKDIEAIQKSKEDLFEKKLKTAEIKKKIAQLQKEETELHDEGNQ
ncbi:hypothetical protein PV328_007637 [Microctonus aethiopoides]|uniref:Uncharacterized protein n=1 Tax=Microctonus aethiopoides TaxID=144406 RepID=A0AA39C948_9HYME|nr:hypothetical protein PV328_007637 [Microctonus aethiopoides]